MGKVLGGERLGYSVWEAGGSFLLFGFFEKNVTFVGEKHTKLWQLLHYLIVLIINTLN